MSFIEEEYLRRISYRLRNFKSKGNHTFNFSCPICGDSQKKASKARGYAFDKGGSLITMCHNCGHSSSFPNFLRTVDPLIYQEFIMERFKNKALGRDETSSDDFDMAKMLSQPKKPKTLFSTLTELKLLDDAHPAKQYALNRKLKIDEWELYYCEKFFTWAKTTTDKFEDVVGKDHSRIVIPFKSKDGGYIGYTARALGDESPKYYRIFVTNDEDEEHIFGIDKIDDSKPVFVLEGEIDSLFLPNAVAVSNGKLSMFSHPNAIYIPDGDRRNPHIVKHIGNMIDAGLKVCLLPDNLPGKDINELIIAGLTVEKIVDIINSNIYHGLTGKMKFNKWKVVK